MNERPAHLPPLTPALTDNLAARYAEPHRHYHTLAHVQALLRHLDTHRALAQQPAHLEAAIWYHDVVYDTHRHDNETCSADVVRFELMSLGWLGVDVERVACMVEATQHHRADPGDTDTLLFLDLDLSVLGTAPAVYDTYRDAIRAEFDWVPEADYRAGRARVLQSFLDRDTIYRTPALKALWETPARANLQRELATLVA
jgi:predicted metal-dependent HD superfamily phosphohydrolase